MSQTPPPPPCPRRENDAYLVPSGSTRPRHRGLALLNEDPLIRSLQFLTLREVNDPSRPIIIPPPPRRRPARSTRESDPPTRVQIKRLSEEAERSVHRQAVALVQKTHTAAFTNQLSENVSLALATQEIIDQKLESKVNALEEAILTIGRGLMTLKSSSRS
ncbi:Endogenous retrovirus group K member 24 Env polyprotein [Manis javanica]|nr:Endogenous retrovirus group K member 24 Env polyprotein [Manis javanica]